MDDTKSTKLIDTVQTSSNGHGRLDHGLAQLINWQFGDSRYSCYLPLQDNHGHPFSLDLLGRVIQSLFKFSGGVTYRHGVICSAPNTGVWDDPADTRPFLDSVLVIDVIVPTSPEADRFFKQWKAHTAQLLGQLEVFVVRQPARILTLETLKANGYKLGFED